MKLEKALNKQEKKLLKSAIKPFRDKVKTLSRIEIGSLGHAIHIRFNGCDENGYDGTIIFIGSEVYKGMVKVRCSAFSMEIVTITVPLNDESAQVIPLGK